MEACHMSPALCIPRYELLGPGEGSSGKPWGEADAAGLEPPQLVPSHASARRKNTEHKRNFADTSWVLMPYRSGLLCFSINEPSTSHLKLRLRKPFSLHDQSYRGSVTHCSCDADDGNGVRSGRRRRGTCRLGTATTAATGNLRH